MCVINYELKKLINVLVTTNQIAALLYLNITSPIKAVFFLYIYVTPPPLSHNNDIINTTLKLFHYILSDRTF